MKTNRIFFAAVLVFSGTCCASAQQDFYPPAPSADTNALLGPISWDQVPMPVRTAVAARANGAEVREVTRGILNGSTVYTIELERSGVGTRLSFAPDGTILSTGGTINEASGALTGSALRFEEMSAAAQRAVTTYAGWGKIQNIAPFQLNGQKGYQVTLENNGQIQQIYVSEQGEIVP